MLRYTKGNLLEANVEALVNTVNTVGVMGKGIALMFKDKYQANFNAYHSACEGKDIEPGQLFITETGELTGPKWIVNFATKKHWRQPSKIEWIASGLDELRIWIENKSVGSIAIPPLGCGNGGLSWNNEVRPLIETMLGSVTGVEILIYEPTREYQNVAKKNGVKTLTLARALVGELIRRYWALGYDCSLLEAQKLVYFLNKYINQNKLRNELKLDFEPYRYGPYANDLTHLLDRMDGSFLHCDKRISDATPEERVWFDSNKVETLLAFLNTGEAKSYLPLIDKVFEYIEGFESPLELEALSTVDWITEENAIRPDVIEIRNRLKKWPGGKGSSERKLRLFDNDLLESTSRRVGEFCS